MRDWSRIGHVINGGSCGKGPVTYREGVDFRTWSKTQGHALVMAVVFVFFLTLFGLAFYRFAETDVDLIGSDRNAMAAYYAAQAGMQKAAWIVKNHRAITAGGSLSTLNPFSTNFYSGGVPLLEDFQQVAHDNQDPLSPGGNAPSRYFRINWVDARGLSGDSQKLMNRVRVQVLGALDVDGDGAAGLSDMDGDNFYIDRDDVNRKFEAVVGLPGSLAENISAGAPDFTYGSGSTSITLIDQYERLVTQDGYDVPPESGFLYYQLGGLGGWDQYGYIFGKPTIQGQIELPPGLFDVDGKPQLAYFSGLDPRTYAGDQIFTSLNDPTAGVNGRDIVFVDGNVTIQGLDFGYLDNSGVLRGADWTETDVTIIATGTITAKDIRCGTVGRLTLIGKDILLVGDYDTQINGVALASGTITLDDQENLADPRGCQFGVLKNGANPAEPVRYTAYFMGTILAGTSINLKNAGWTVLFDDKVINGLMYDGTVSKPTRVYESAENSGFPGDWQMHGEQLRTRQEQYTQAEIDGGEAVWWDTGGDNVPELMRIYQEPTWEPITSLNPDNHDYGIEDQLEYDHEDLTGTWEDWSSYRALTFWMSLDNFGRISGSRETRRMFYFRVRLEGENPTTFADFGGPSDGYYLSNYHGAYDNATNPGDGTWRHVRIPLSEIDPAVAFDIDGVDEIRFQLRGLELSWYTPSGERRWIDYDTSGSDYGVQGKFVLHEGGNVWPVRFWQQLPDVRHRLYYTTGGDPHDTAVDPENDPNDQWIFWNPDPADPANMVPLYFEDHLDPNMRIDQIQVRGRPASNAFLEYGLPRAFHYAVTHLQEYEIF
ncbi:MAG: hypothetical protein GTN81_10780 [Proteobacteria bacterium]|nr:hypothetical protein [Pseudomonadota bacterium]